jgi:predicted nucleic acid-binding protein
MNVVDWSGWLEYFAEETNAHFFAPVIEDKRNLIVASISLHEVFKRILQQRSENDALLAVAQMMQGQVIELDSALALRAAKLSSGLSLPMADSIILATAQMYNAILWTQDQDFKGIEGVRFIEKRK